MLAEWVPNERLRLHMKQVGAVMRAWALEREGADEKTALKWELAGLLHDADWEKHPESHCRVIIEHLEAPVPLADMIDRNQRRFLSAGRDNPPDSDSIL